MSTLVLVNGFWHGSWCWSRVVPHIVAAGHAAVAVDLAGHGLYARRPRWASGEAYDPEAVLSEPSPVADVSLGAAAELLTSQLKQIGGGAPVTVVAHSAAGPVLTRVAEEMPGLVAHAVYLTAYLPASGVSALEAAQLPEAVAENQVLPLLRGDPAAIGALRLDTVTSDADYRRGLSEAFYADVEPTLAEAATALLTPDGPLGIMTGTTTVTADGWGSVPRTYVRCTKDKAIGPVLQSRFISDADAMFPDNPTVVRELDASHSPFLSVPEELAEVLVSLDDRAR